MEHIAQIKETNADLVRIQLLGVDYTHVRAADGGDLYLTDYGLPFAEFLKLGNWREPEWFKEHRERLCGTSTVYRVRTKPLNGKSIDIVVKWCRVGEHVPLDTASFTKFSEAEFNSPYEEFSLLMEMRKLSAPGSVRTHRPLAIFVPAERLAFWQTGRSRSKMLRKNAKYSDVELDMCRQYILIYEWIDGIAADKAFSALIADPEERRTELMKLTDQIEHDLESQGYLVMDHKPTHIILRRRKGNGSLLRSKSGRLFYAIVDFELLSRTPGHEMKVREARRSEYLKSQRDRFIEDRTAVFPEHLSRPKIFGVNYVAGHAESTQGTLWVVGQHHELFDYFVPERWRRTQKKLLSETNKTYYTETKDQIKLVWKVSRVGEQPDIDPSDPHASAIVEYGFNSPFEEFDIALELTRKGIDTTYPRAIYMSGRKSDQAGLYVVDNSRYESHKNLFNRHGVPILRPDHSYITIWGYWNGLDDMLADEDQSYCEGLGLEKARERDLINYKEMMHLLERQEARLENAGFIDLALKPTHFLVSILRDGSLLRDEFGEVALRICNMELIKRTGEEADYA